MTGASLTELNNLPNENLSNIFSSIYADDNLSLLSIRRVCSKWNSLTTRLFFQDISFTFGGKHGEDHTRVMQREIYNSAILVRLSKQAYLCDFIRRLELKFYPRSGRESRNFRTQASDLFRRSNPEVLILDGDTITNLVSHIPQSVDHLYLYRTWTLTALSFLLNKDNHTLKYICLDGSGLPVRTRKSILPKPGGHAQIRSLEMRLTHCAWDDMPMILLWANSLQTLVLHNNNFVYYMIPEIQPRHVVQRSVNLQQDSLEYLELGRYITWITEPLLDLSKFVKLKRLRFNYWDLIARPVDELPASLPPNLEYLETDMWRNGEQRDCPGVHEDHVKCFLALLKYPGLRKLSEIGMLHWECFRVGNHIFENSAEREKCLAPIRLFIAQFKEFGIRLTLPGVSGLEDV